MKKFFLDDVRNPIDCVSYMHTRIGKLNPIYLDKDWIVVKNYNEFVSAIEENFIQITHVSFDHDLAGIDSEEWWLPVVGYETLYEVSNYGRVRSLPRNTTKGKILSPGKSVSGLTVQLRNSGNDKTYTVHRIVAEAFLLNPENKKQVNHIDGNRWNNFVLNLEWTTNSENVKHSYDNLERNYSAYGENHKNSTAVSQYDKHNNYIGTYGSINEAGRQKSIPFTNIAKCSRGERKSAGGYIWKCD